MQRIIQKGLTLVAAFPEATSALVFRVGLTSQVFIQAFHQPAKIKQASAPAFNDFQCSEGFCWVSHTCLPTRYQRVAREQPHPAFSHLLGGPGQRAMPVYLQYQMVMIGGHRVGTEVDGEHLHQQGKPIHYPLPTMLVILA
ncbi:hypothetical protein A167_00433 [Alcanivorax sp. S71-1-4]|uniref:hypothetical protein n=1 Tax=Alcanivorax sp. S71-1-4 TaxID=1177159 RepID=UPI0016A32D35|nr:hypothetical protein [Alcanivorax sp. S71-1-4]KAF0810946.1 hypothetical protein A167_00433 [Alcanivorax sp. S71-1-4]